MKKEMMPEISVIIASYNSRKTISACLDSLRLQKTSRPFEVVLVDSFIDDTATFVSSKYPDVKLFTFKDRKYPGEARNIGIEGSRAPIIAFIDADCVASPDWIENIARAHASPKLAIGGAIANGNIESYVGWAAYFTEFSQWMPGSRVVEMGDIAAASMTYKKVVFKKFGLFMESGYCSDTELHWRLASYGVRLRFDPSIRIAHTNIDGLLRFIAHEYGHGRAFARMRIVYSRFSSGRRLVYAVSLPIVFLKLFFKVAWRNIMNPVYLGQYLKSLPLVAVGILGWSVGEAIGYIRGR